MMTRRTAPGILIHAKRLTILNNTLKQTGLNPGDANTYFQNLNKHTTIEVIHIALMITSHHLTFFPTPQLLCTQIYIDIVIT